MDSLELIYEQNTWANLEILDACSKLSDEQLDDSVDSGFYGSIRETLRHIVAAEERYIFRLTEAKPPDGFIGEQLDVPSVEDLRRRAIDNGEKLKEAAGRVEIGQTFLSEMGADKFEVEKYVVVIQAINHGNEHRTQIKTLMSQRGVQPPEIDGWTFGWAKGALRKLD